MLVSGICQKKLVERLDKFPEPIGEGICLVSKPWYISIKLPCDRQESLRTETDNLDLAILNKLSLVLYCNFSFVPTVTIEYSFYCITST